MAFVWPNLISGLPPLPSPHSMCYIEHSTWRWNHQSTTWIRPWEKASYDVIRKMLTEKKIKYLRFFFQLCTLWQCREVNCQKYGPRLKRYRVVLSCLIRPWLAENTAHICKSTLCMPPFCLPTTPLLFFGTQNFSLWALTSPTILLLYFGFSKSVAWSLWWLYMFSRLCPKQKTCSMFVAQASAARTPWSHQLCTYCFRLWYKHSDWLNRILYFNLLLLCCWQIGSPV